MNVDNQECLVLVSGASGFIAAHIIKLLLQEGYRVRGTLRNLKDEKKITPLRNLVPSKAHNLEFVQADLMKEDGWAEAVKGCTYVLHTASPFPAEVPKNEDEIIKPAVNGTLFLIRACAQSGSTVKRVVLTSSCAAVFGDQFIGNNTYTEKDWPNVTNLYPYTKSKILAEKAAWDFVKEKEKKNESCFQLAVVNPGLVLGPLLHDSPCTSIEVIKSLMTNAMPFLPDVNFPITDVRDVALAHVRAMVIPEASNNRHIIVCRPKCVHFKELAEILQQEFGSTYSIPTKVAPNCLMKFFSLFYKPIEQLALNLGRNASFDNTRLVQVLGVRPIPLKDSVIDMANNLIDRKIIPDKRTKTNF